MFSTEKSEEKPVSDIMPIRPTSNTLKVTMYKIRQNENMFVKGKNCLS
jgi:hypothetical protein